MAMRTARTQRHQVATARWFLVIAALLFAAGLSGCSSNKLSYAKLALPYDHTQLRSTTALEVLNFARDPAYQFLPEEADPVLVTQSDTAVAYSGQSVNGRKTWLDLIVFDDSHMMAARKYFFCVDERAAILPPRVGVLFDCEVAVDPAVLTTPYATEEAQKIALVKWLATRFQNDVTALTGSPKAPTQGNQQITVARVLTNQLFQGILAELSQSPGLAKNLGTEQGISFPNLSLGAGHLCLLVTSDVATVTIRVNLPLASLAK